MGEPAIVQGDPIIGDCKGHQIPSPKGDPIPAPPMPFAAPLTRGLVASVLIMGRPAAVLGSGGTNTVAHVGLHPADPFMAPPTQQGVILGSSPTVVIGGIPAARRTPPPKMCLHPGSIMGSATTVLVG